jgi:hypothetical protein
MCWHFPSSLYVGLQIWTIAFYLLFRNRDGDRADAIILMAFSSIRFVEAALWLDLDREMSPGDADVCSPWNRLLSSFILPVALGTQVMVSALLPHSRKRKTAGAGGYSHAWLWLALSFSGALFWVFGAAAVFIRNHAEDAGIPPTGVPPSCRPSVGRTCVDTAAAESPGFLAMAAPCASDSSFCGRPYLLLGGSMLLLGLLVPLHFHLAHGRLDGTLAFSFFFFLGV